MCRSIKPLYNYDPPATDDDIRQASLQFVREISGFSKPSKVNEKSFERAIDDMSKSSRNLLNSLVTSAKPHKHKVA